MPFRLREKLASGGLIGVLVGSMWLVGLDTLWHGGPPVWFPYRYAFLLCFVLLLLGASALARDAVNLMELSFAGGLLAVVAGLLLFAPAGCRAAGFYTRPLWALCWLCCLWR